MKGSTHATRRRAALLGIATLLIYLATAGGSLATTDAVVTYEVTRNLLNEGSVALTDGRMVDEALRGVDGRFYSPFGIGQSIYNLPFYVAGSLVAGAIGERFGAPDMLPKAAVALGSAFAAAACVWVVYLFAWRLSGDSRAAALAALGLAFGSALWPYSKFGFNAPLTALALTTGVYGVWLAIDRSRLAPFAWGGAALGFALLTRHEMAVAAVPVIAWAVSNSHRNLRRRAFALTAAGPAIAFAIWLAYNELRFGNPLYAGHEPGLGFTGFTGLLLSPGGSIFLYSPIAVAGVAALIRLRRDDPRTVAILGSVVVVLFVFYASLDDWLGTRSYGPRYLVALLPLLCVPLAPALSTNARTWRLTIATAAGIGVVVQLPGIMVDPGKVNVALGRPGPVTVQERRHDWTLSALVLNARATTARLGPNIGYVLGSEAPPQLRSAGNEDPLSDRLAFSLDFWWLYAFYLGVLPVASTLIAPAALLICAGALIYRSMRPERT